MRRAVIFVNGDFTPPPTFERIITPDTYIIAVDGGTRHALGLGVVPHLLIGDLDSVSPDALARLKAERTTVLPFSSQKDETDLELAFRHVRQMGIFEVVLLGASGGRLDHSFANIFLLTHSVCADLRITIIDGGQTLFLIRDTATITGRPGDLVSILPIGGDAVGVSNTGLEWPLCNEMLPCGSPRGISNVLSADQAVISVRQGLLLCIITHQKFNGSA